MLSDRLILWRGKLLVGLRALPELILTKANQSTFNMECWSDGMLVLLLLLLWSLLVLVEVIVFAE